MRHPKKPVGAAHPPPRRLPNPPHRFTTSPTSPALPLHFPYSQKCGGSDKSLCAKALCGDFPHFPNIRYILLPSFSFLLFLLFFSPIKKGRCWGSWGSPHITLSLPVGYDFPHIFPSGGSWGKLGWCGEIGFGGWGEPQKKYPPKSGGDGYFARKGGAKLRRSLRSRGAV